jgi:protein ImuB
VTSEKQHWQDASATQPRESNVRAVRNAGIRADMPLAEATALASYAEHGPPHLELHDPLADRLALESLAEWCQRFSPSVGLEEGESPESLLLDVSGLGELFGGERALAQRVVRQFEDRNLAARVAIADTLGAAWAVAHFAELEMTDAGKGAGKGDKPLFSGGLSSLFRPLIVPPGRAHSAIAPLSVAALRLPGETCALLADLGLRRIEQVEALARSTLRARFGPAVLARLDQASGAAAEAIVARALPPECQFEWLFEYPTGRREMIDYGLAQLIARACQALARQRRGILRLRCCFETENRQAQEFMVGMYRPSANERHVGELARLKLEALRFGRPVAAIRLTVLATDRLGYRQQEIFADAHAGGESPRELAVLVDRLSNRLGAQAVLRPWLLAGAQPEFTCQYRPLASLAAHRDKRRNRGGQFGRARLLPSREHWQNASGTHSTGGQATPGIRKKSRGKDADATRGVPGDRPLHLRARPLPLGVVGIAPEGPPAQFHLAGRDHRVARVWGPERIETGWWRTRCVRRDYYQVETSGGQRFWLFRELNSGAWFLHGEFV